MGGYAQALMATRLASKRKAKKNFKVLQKSDLSPMRLVDLRALRVFLRLARATLLG